MTSIIDIVLNCFIALSENERQLDYIIANESTRFDIVLQIKDGNALALRSRLSGHHFLGPFENRGDCAACIKLPATALNHLTFT